MPTQNYCLVSLAGWKTMGAYDMATKWIRELISESPFNICIECFAEKCFDNGFSIYQPLLDHNKNIANTILKQFEDQIRQELTQS